MKLLLSSSGLESREVRKVFQEKIESLKVKKVGFVCYEKREDHKGWLKEKIDELKEVNSNLEIVIINLSEDVQVDKIPEVDMFYVCGGNQFYILNRMRELCLNTYILNGLEEDKFYFGISAGSMIAGQDIMNTAILCSDKNEVEMNNGKGFELIPFDILPHYSAEQKKEVVSFHKKNDISIVAVTDNQAVLVWDDEMEIVGPENEGLLLD